MRAPRALLRFLRKHDSHVAAVDGDPRKLPLAGFRRLQEGAEVVAFRYGAYVVKRHTKVKRPFPVEQARALGIYPPQEWVVNGWVVQPFYRRFRWARNAPWAKALFNCVEDFGPRNIGKDERGRMVAFDW